MNNKEIGEFGESAVASHLTKNKYKILIRNFRCPFGEIDIIASLKNELHFIEVKTRSSEKYGQGREAVGYAKQQKIIKTAQYYLQSNNIDNTNCSFDVAEVVISCAGYKINMICNAFYE